MAAWAGSTVASTGTNMARAELLPARVAPRRGGEVGGGEQQPAHDGQVALGRDWLVQHVEHEVRSCLQCMAYAWRMRAVCMARAARRNSVVQRVAWCPLRSPAAITSSRSRSRTIGSAAIHSGKRQSLKPVLASAAREAPRMLKSPRCGLGVGRRTMSAGVGTGSGQQ